ncbi:TetM/TetW/TetO/TetS family tetracycline resistance ribosomal protection protein [Paenibacillus melissococcoides]|uniref:TetM/TetW/TetO/TetS family tetracycline resistance ribosomal protection protein n=1 Tax=Paenibacillus melissococcoides TaxID=2912268 RepID=A0ABN8UIB1_9BACL|nr:MULTISPECIES: TetM/TetW/TetO/TetS family tetracycline resistance ribosomal protection protein [Paenibacillus]MEB9895836.1 TetM/TetW/TetO/TetS family tetracycline resistance ribosomal protection protein [Bacillus cereus]CAH8249621.1 TetM/TetW/TetO/TetS family tetracycline resistance ribosomal protection protein [Paenibacillus melissococcoides]CAH8721406.1 TetM/TetW/TetO/TetS family tetracycline resistance ribosomal protection protein [Paenibacillus melissococcoides]CAH8721814.1 TetM/TetW/TetO
MHRTIGIFAHVDAGKTTLAEQLLYHTRSIRSRGRVDNRDACMDSHEIEKERGITIFADQAVMTYNGTTYTLIDTPGHVDFSAEMERAIQVMDAAIVVVSAAEGVQGHTETVWQLLNSHRVPVFFFINKTDRTGADAERVLDDIRVQLTPDAVDMSSACGEAEWEDGLITFLAERDEELLVRYMEDEYDREVWRNAAAGLIRTHRLFPCAAGSALQDVGVTELLQLVDDFTPGSWLKDQPFAARVYKIRHDANGARVTHLKVLGGSLHVRDEVRYGPGPDRIAEKVTSIRIYNGRKYDHAEQAEAGQLCAVTGLSAAAAGEGLGALNDRAEYEMVPMLTSKVIFPPSLHVKEVLQRFRLLDAEDPSLRVQWDEALQEIHIHVMGVIQLEVLERLVKERFGMDVSFGTPDILYKETIASAVTGCGHFEPLGHYAEVHLRLEPGARGSGMVFRNECHPDVLTVNYQHVIEQYLLERDHHGLLTGSPVTDVNMTLTKGRAHNKHTSGGDFREAACRALRQGLEQADNVLLEPYYEVKVKVASEHMGRVMTDIQKAAGRFDPPQFAGDQVVITGKAPVATFMNYSAELAAYTQGKGMLQLRFGGYERCHNAEEIIKAKAYNKDADPLYTSASIFCAKGQGYSVPWEEAARHMHC